MPAEPVIDEEPTKEQSGIGACRQMLSKSPKPMMARFLSHRLVSGSCVAGTMGKSGETSSRVRAFSRAPPTSSGR